MMKTKKFLASVLAATMTITTLPAATNFVPTSITTLATAEHTVNSQVNRYFYDQLKGNTETETKAYQNFYNAMEQMLNEGIFANGGELDLVNANYFTSEQVSGYAGGNGNILNVYGAARDAFTGDHPEVFYVDFSALTIRIKTIGGVYHMYLGSGRRDTYWTESFTSAERVKNAIATFDSDFDDAYAQVEEAAQALADEAKTDVTDADFVEAAHDYVTKHTSYRLEDKFDEDDKAQYLIRTAYGSLVNQKAVCEGYARLFKALLDKKGINCVLIQGAYRPDADSYELHMWTYVELGGAWYAVDPTMDDPTNSKKFKEAPDAVGVDDYENHEYLLKGENKMAVKYAPSGIRSESNYEFSYPELNYDNYGTEVVYNSNGLVVKYSETVQQEGEKAGEYRVSYKGMGLRKAREEGYYMLFDSVVEKTKYASSSTDTSKNGMTANEMLASVPLGDYGWTGWCYLAANAEIFTPGLLDEPSGDMYDTETEFVFKLPQCPYVRFAVTTVKPDPYSFGDLEMEDSYYHGDNLKLIAQTDKVYNPNGFYKAPPYPKQVSPSLSSALLIDDGTQTISSTYDKDLVYDEEAGKVTLRMCIKDQYNIINTSAFANSQVSNFRVFYVDDSGETVESDTIDITLQSVRKEEQMDRFGEKKYNETPGEEIYISGNQSAEYLKGKTIKGFAFDFTPSTMYADDNIFYEFDVKGIRGETLSVPYEDVAEPGVTKHTPVKGKEPIPLSFLAAHRCASYAFQSQGYDWNVFGKPTLMDGLDGFDFSKAELTGDTSDLGDALEGLTHRMVLVATDANDEQVSKMDELMENEKDGLGNLEQAAELENAEYYNINLTLCKAQIISTGQAVRVTLGFPAGYGPEDKGKTFKVYHFSKDDKGNITGVNEIPCEITEYGLVVWCDAFSPFAVVPIDIATAESTLKGIELDEFKAEVSQKSVIFADNSVGGKVSATGENKNQSGIVTVNENGKAVINITADEGYDIESIVVNGKTQTFDGKDTVELELPYTSLDNGANVVEVEFVSEKVVEKDKEEEATPVKPRSEHATKFKDGFSSVIGHTITLNGNIHLNFYTQFKEGTNLDGAKAVITAPNGKVTELKITDSV
jgi:hypothetical protein